MDDRGAKRGASNSPKDNPTKAKRTTKESAETGTKHSDQEPNKGPDGVPTWDLGGCGDCGYRALAATQSARNKKYKNEITERIDKLTLSLRKKSVLHT